jgi:hypothetical protein
MAAFDMDPKHPLKPKGQRTIDKLTRRDLERIANPMSVILGYTQLMQRRVRRGQVIDEQEMLRVLGLIEQASRRMITGLTEVSEKAVPDEGNSGPNQ